MNEFQPMLGADPNLQISSQSDRPPTRSCLLRVCRPLGTVAAVLLIGIPLWGGCTGGSRTRNSPPTAASAQGGLFKLLAYSLNHLEEFESGQMLEQVREQLNQWVSTEHPPIDDWKPEPLVATLPSDLQQLPELKTLADSDYTREDVKFLQEAIWLRDIARTTQQQAAEFRDKEYAESLFDWTIRNLQLLPDRDESHPTPMHLPRDILLASQATAEERGWIFVLLARQAGLDAVMLALPKEAGMRPVPWVVAVADKKELLLFDPRLGLPIPGPNGKGIATLAEVLADDGLLRALDVEDKASRRTLAYRVKAEDLQKIVPWIEASPGYLSKRMKLIQIQPRGADVVLNVDASALAERLQGIPHLEPARLWPLGYETLEQRAIIKKELRPPAQQEGQEKEVITSSETVAIAKVAVLEQFTYLMQPQLIAGRAMQFKGLYNGPPRANAGKEKKFKQLKDEQEVLQSSGDPAAQTRRAFQGPEGAKQAFMNARPSDAALNEAARNPALQVPYDMAKKFAPLMLGLDAFGKDDFPTLKAAYDAAKQNASFWLGIIAYDEGNYDVAIDYFLKRTLEAYPDGPWSAAAQYNLGRSYEKIGEPEQAIKLYEDDDSPQRHGNLLRASRLKAELNAETPAATP